MITTRTLTVVTLGLVLSTHALQGQDRSRYRDFRLGSDLQSVSALTTAVGSDAKTIHQRPAVIQQLVWRPPYFLRGTAAPQNDPVQQIVFSFYNDQLFRLAITYDRQRTEGMTDTDLIEAISTTYGPPLQPAVKKARAVASELEEESGTPVTRWGGVDYSVALYRLSYASGFRLIVSSPSLEALAQTAEAEAIRLDGREAPQREIARQKKEAEDTRLSQEKARLTNKAAFRP
jgi:hypothetical protein